MTVRIITKVPAGDLTVGGEYKAELAKTPDGLFDAYHVENGRKGGAWVFPSECEEVR